MAGGESSARQIWERIAFEPSYLIDYFKAKYLQYLRELVDPERDLMHYLDAKDRIEAWHEMIAPYVANDTGEDMEIVDQPAWWGNHSEYRLLDPNPDTNFFRVKAASVP